MSLVWVMKMTIVQVVDVTVVLDAQMVAVFAVYVCMVVMNLMAQKMAPVRNAASQRQWHSQFRWSRLR
jgi:hypothetical protein